MVFRLLISYILVNRHCFYIVSFFNRIIQTLQTVKVQDPDATSRQLAELSLEGIREIANKI